MRAYLHSKEELTQYFTELTQTEVREYMRPNLFANTPDILHEYLQEGGRPAFRVRLLLAATLSPLYGIYSGYELSENRPVKPGSEEYLDSEKYQLRWRDFDAPGNLDDDIAKLNRVRRAHRALQVADNLAFVSSENDQLLAFLKLDPEREGDILVVANVDPHRAHEGMVHVPLDLLGRAPDEAYAVQDLLTGARYVWRGSRNYVRLDPAQLPGHVFRIERREAV